MTTPGSTNVSLYAYFVDDDGGTAPGEPTTGKLFSDIETGGSASYMRQGAARVDFTLITLASASATHADGGFILVDDTNMPGLYRVDVPDAAFAAGVDFVIVQMVMAAANNSIMRPLRVDLSAPQTGDSFARIGAPAGASVSADIADKTGYALSATGLDAIGQAATGMVEIAKAIWDRVLSGATHNIATSAGRRLRALQDSGAYEGGAVWIDTINGTAGTTDFENGTVTNPVDSLADARTLATSLNLTRFQVANGSTITLASNSDGLNFMGENWTLAFGGQSVASAYFEGAIDVSGVSSGNDVRMQRCHIKTCTVGNIWASDCRLGGTVTLISTGGHFFQACYATTGTLPIIDLGAVGAQTLCLTPLTGGIDIRNTGAGDLVHIEGQGEILLDVSCNGGTLEYAGDFRFTNNATSITVNPDDNTVNLAAALADSNELQTDWTDGGRLDLILDIVAADVVNIDGAAMRGTDGASTTTPPTAAANAAAVLTTQMTESYAANGVAPTLAEAQFAIHQMLQQFGIAGTSLTVRKLDDATTAFVVTLDDATSPTDAKRV